MRIERLFFTLATAAVGVAAPVGDDQGQPPPANAADYPRVLDRTQEGITLLNHRYWSPSLGIWFADQGDDPRAHFEGRHNPPWWPSANAVEMLVDFMNVTATAGFDTNLSALYHLQKNPTEKMARLVAELKRRGQWSDADEEAVRGRLAKAKPAGEQQPLQSTEASGPAAEAYYSDFQNEYLDDSGWWAIAWLKVFDRTKDPGYLATAKHIHAHMAKDWRPDKGGGILWCEDEGKQRPNAITNSLFLILSARLYERTHEAGYLAWADKTLAWMHSVSLYDGVGVVDAPGHQGDYWSYNQGAYIGGLISLYQSTGRRGCLDEAVQVASTALQRAGFTLPNGVIVEKLNSHGDAALFKGIFVRYLAQLESVLRAGKLEPAAAALIDRSLRASAASILDDAAGPGGLYGAEWHPERKEQDAGFNSQLSALIALVGFLQISGR